MVKKINGRVLVRDLDGGYGGLVEETDTTITFDPNKHRNKFVRCTNASAITVTVPTGAKMLDGDWCQFIQGGAGALTVQGASGVTVNAADEGSKELSAAGDSTHLRKVAEDADEYVLL